MSGHQQLMYHLEATAVRTLRLTSTPETRVRVPFRAPSTHGHFSCCAQALHRALVTYSRLGSRPAQEARPGGAFLHVCSFACSPVGPREAAGGEGRVGGSPGQLSGLVTAGPHAAAHPLPQWTFLFQKDPPARRTGKRVRVSVSRKPGRRVPSAGQMGGRAGRRGPCQAGAAVAASPFSTRSRLAGGCLLPLSATE